jgi:hypothetical protein
MPPRALSAVWLLFPIGLFAAAVLAHDAVVRRRADAERAASVYERGLARLDGRWAGAGETGSAFTSDDHPYAADLDLFGAGSMFERLCTAVTPSGQATLARRLLEPAPHDEARARQVAVGELRPALDLREDLARLGHDVRAGVEPEALVRWATAPPVGFPSLARPISALLAAANAGGALTWALGGGPHVFFATSAVSGAWALWLGDRVDRSIGAADRPGRDLALLGRLLARLERERFRAPLLSELRARLDADGDPPSRQVARLARLSDRLESRRNTFFAPIALPLLWTTQVALALEGWRRRVGPAIPRWVAAVGEIEALSALAAYAYENPDDPFPELVDEGPLFDASLLAHPLLPTATAVRNDVHLDGGGRLLLVSGSNMSGKSTLLRAVGLNLALARAGAPVRAAALRVSPLSLGASIRINDSLSAGRSRFYAEIARIRQLMDLARDRPPLLFLLDEILHGTNSGDRRAGAEAVVKGLLARGAVGLVTTHDLALAAIAEAPGSGGRNVHFEDHLEWGRMAFDYRLKDGVVRKSNALALMRAVGLDV